MKPRSLSKVSWILALFVAPALGAKLANQGLVKEVEDLRTYVDRLEKAIDIVDANAGKNASIKIRKDVDFFVDGNSAFGGEVRSGNLSLKNQTGLMVPGEATEIFRGEFGSALIFVTLTGNDNTSYNRTDLLLVTARHPEFGGGTKVVTIKTALADTGTHGEITNAVYSGTATIVDGKLRVSITGTATRKEGNNPLTFNVGGWVLSGF